MLNRRDLLRNGGLAALGLILPPLTGPTFLSRKLLAGPVGAGTGAKKMKIHFSFIIENGPCLVPNRK